LIAAALLLGLGAWQLGEGAYIHAKAALAQVLLEDAWTRTLAGEDRVRPWPWADTWPVARLRLPRQSEDLIVLAGDSGRSLAFGPGHRFGTALPGDRGTSLIGGHRDTHFAALRELAVGDEAFVQTASGAWRRYSVTATAVVPDTAMPVLSRERSVILLVTCYPFDALRPGGHERYVVELSAVPTVIASSAAA
jgi:sortase A